MTAPRLDGLTGLRFVAALLVFVHHTLSPSIVPLGLARVPGTQDLAQLGAVGVTFFFVLSGFVLTWSWRPGDRSGFYGRRFARVWPLHAVTFVLAAVVVLPLVGRPVTTWQDQLAGLLLLQSWSWSPTTAFAGNGPSWSLSCEAFFYAVLPLLVPLLGVWSRRRALALVAFAVAFLGLVPLLLMGSDTSHSLLSLWVFPGYRAAEFLVGVVLGWAFLAGWRPRWSVGRAAATVLVTYLVVAALLGPVASGEARHLRPLANLYGDLAMLLPFAALIGAVAAADLAGRNRFLAAPLAVRLGEVSFAFYLVHSMVVLVLVELGHLRAVARGLPLTALALAVSLALAWLLHRSVERPLERRLRAWLADREATGARALLK